MDEQQAPVALAPTAHAPAEDAPTAGGAAGPTVVGIGAPAGALAARRAFFADVPERTGLTYVVILHLSPEPESHLAELLRRNSWWWL